MKNLAWPSTFKHNLPSDLWQAVFPLLWCLDKGGIIALEKESEDKKKCIVLIQ